MNEYSFTTRDFLPLSTLKSKRSPYRITGFKTRIQHQKRESHNLLTLIRINHKKKLDRRDRVPAGRKIAGKPLEKGGFRAKRDHLPGQTVDRAL
jgi:hypothetical protein